MAKAHLHASCCHGTELSTTMHAGLAAAPADTTLPLAPAPAPGSPASDCKQTAELLFVQTAGEAEITAGPGGNLTLVLRDVSRITTYFTGASCSALIATRPLSGTPVSAS